MQKTDPKSGFKSMKELAAAYGISTSTFQRNLKKDLPLLYAMKHLGRTGRKWYSPAEQELLFTRWGKLS